MKGSFTAEPPVFSSLAIVFGESDRWRGDFSCKAAGWTDQSDVGRSGLKFTPKVQGSCQHGSVSCSGDRGQAVCGSGSGGC
ncbi:hypothetical protein Fuma_03153 [Fuerstiella marisgermanici]|uniref:Uncharacterized protein n=1 Tax=Fuerstiella marisgermanici TaxID=1891926 RepID=A0A1P8WHK7_9PLAN|nr:hypothetical protein Fuma_03153 [Fuerstiella marisgermanici]